VLTSTIFVSVKILTFFSEYLMIERINRESLSTMLKGPLPGESAQYKMAPDGRRGEREKGKEECRSAAVLIVLFPEGNQVHTVFMKRNEYDGPHSGQISFPGGMFEESDHNLMHTALRETEEETGIREESPEVLGKLTPLYIPVSNFCVTPYVGWLTKRPDFHPDSSEVQYLLTPSFEDLMAPSNHHKENILRHGYDVFTPYIRLDKDIVWGATAMILSEFMELIGR
jgi:8-oxo-dGTP pyrophosphatase MutT (NUDIX family)